MALSAVKHSKRKVKAAFRRGKRTSSRASGERTIKVTIRVGRAATVGQGREGQYHARACLVSTRDERDKRCGNSSYGTSPTAATKKALRALATRIK